jgi:hypothetical protein
VQQDLFFVFGGVLCGITFLKKQGQTERCAGIIGTSMRPGNGFQRPVKTLTVPGAACLKETLKPM